MGPVITHLSEICVWKELTERKLVITERKILRRTFGTAWRIKKKPRAK
jgi:hypothetical protein